MFPFGQLQTPDGFAETFAAGAYGICSAFFVVFLMLDTKFGK